MTGNEQVRAWKDPDERDEPGDSHPAGRLELRSAARAAMRSALLGGALAATIMVFGEIGPPPTLTITRFL